MHIEIIGCLGISGPAKISLDGVTALCGHNGAGKSSALSAIAACLTNLTPRPTKADLASFVTSGLTKGHARMVDGDGSIEVNWPSGTIRSYGNGRFPIASAYACGLISILDQKPVDRAKTLSEALNAIPTDDEVTAEFIKGGLGERIAGEVIAGINKSGWDETLKHWQMTRREAKRAWEKIATGNNYGGNAAVEWCPHGWEPDLSTADAASLIAAMVSAKASVEMVLRASGASDAKKADIVGKVAKIESARTALANAVKLTAELTRASRDAAKTFEGMPKPAGLGFPCPHCGSAIVGTGPYQALKVMPFEERERISREWESAKSKADAAAIAASAAVAAEMPHRAALSIFEGAKRELDTILAAERGDPGAKVIGTMPVISLESAKEALTKAETRLAARNAWAGAKAEHDRVVESESVVGILAPDGLRNKKMLTVLDKLNRRLARLCEVSGIKPVQLTESLECTFDGRRYPEIADGGDLSTGQAFMCRLAIQVAISLMDGSGAILVDITRPLDYASVLAAVEMLDVVRNARGSQIRFSVIAITTLTGPHKPPAVDLTRAGVGCVSYWVSSGTVVPLADAIAERNSREA